MKIRGQRQRASQSPPLPPPSHFDQVNLNINNSHAPHRVELLFLLVGVDLVLIIYPLEMHRRLSVKPSNDNLLTRAYEILDSISDSTSLTTSLVDIFNEPLIILPIVLPSSQATTPSSYHLSSNFICRSNYRALQFAS